FSRDWSSDVCSSDLERDVLPGKARHAHVDGDGAVRVLLGVEDAGHGFEGKDALAGFGGERLDDAARAVAAGLGAAAVGVQDLDKIGRATCRHRSWSR